MLEIISAVLLAVGSVILAAIGTGWIIVTGEAQPKNSGKQHTHNDLPVSDFAYGQIMDGIAEKIKSSESGAKTNANERLKDLPVKKGYSPKELDLYTQRIWAVLDGTSNGKAKQTSGNYKHH